METLSDFIALYIGTINATSQVDQAICDLQPWYHEFVCGIISILAFIGLVANILLLYLFLTTISRVRWSIYLIYLALLDAFMCFLFLTTVTIFYIARLIRFADLYHFFMDIHGPLFALSKIVQACIPYVLIASSAERLWSIIGKHKEENSTTRHIIVVTVISVFWIITRVPMIRAFEVSFEKNCSDFENRILYLNGLIENLAYRPFDIFLQCLHLFVSFLVLFVVNGATIYRLFKSHDKARRNSSCPAILLSTARSIAEEEERREYRRLISTVKTTIVVLSSYLLCNSVNFVLYCVETFFPNYAMTEQYNFYTWYIVASDIGTLLFVVSSVIRIFIYYEYNPDVRMHLRQIGLVKMLLGEDFKKNSNDEEDALKCNEEIQVGDLKSEEVKDPDAPMDVHRYHLQDIDDDSGFETNNYFTDIPSDTRVRTISLSDCAPCPSNL